MILIEKTIPALAKQKTKLATEVFKEWQSSNRAVRDVLDVIYMLYLLAINRVAKYKI